MSGGLSMVSVMSHGDNTCGSLGIFM